MALWGWKSLGKGRRRISHSKDGRCSLKSFLTFRFFISPLSPLFSFFFYFQLWYSQCLVSSYFLLIFQLLSGIFSAVSPLFSSLSSYFSFVFSFFSTFNYPQCPVSSLLIVWLLLKIISPVSPPFSSPSFDFSAILFFFFLPFSIIFKCLVFHRFSSFLSLLFIFLINFQRFYSPLSPLSFYFFLLFSTVFQCFVLHQSSLFLLPPFLSLSLTFGSFLSFFLSSYSSAISYSPLASLLSIFNQPSQCLVFYRFSLFFFFSLSFSRYY